ncbi:MAG: DUF4410 domain-containing protein [Nitrospiraceae bacterium]|nr:MAG: DUF4410 domain-containing protein [Nitrospiraceae bacterium]
MKKYKFIGIIVIISIFLISNLPAAEILDNEIKDVQTAIQENISLLKLEVVDRTAGNALPKDDLSAIEKEIIKHINNKFPSIKVISGEADKTNVTLRVFIDVFTAGNRALRFWVGLGAGKAHMRMTAEWLEGTPPQLKDSKEYQRFGAASLRSGESIELQMTELIGRYSTEFVSKNINQ